MNNRKPALAVIGGDMRQLISAARLACDFDVRLYGFEGPPQHAVPADPACCAAAWETPANLADQIEAAGHLCQTLREALDGAAAVLLALPAGSDGIHVSMPLSGEVLTFSALADAMRAAEVKLLLGGKLHPVISAMMNHAGIVTADYYTREEFAVANAIPTAEGAAAIAMQELPVTLHGSHALVIGYGRIGRVLASMLADLGAHVTVSARKPSDFAWIAAASLRSAVTPQLAELLAAERFDVIFNTVPHTVLGEKELRVIPRETLLVDLASAPGGIDRDAAAFHRVIWALSLPGKVAPVTAGGIIADTVRMMLGEAGLC